MAGTFHVITYGCQMNKNDSERISGVLCGAGMREVSEPEMSDVIVVNTCSVRQTAEDRVFGNAKEFARLRNTSNPDLIIAITGCMPGRDRDGSLRKKLPEVDLFFPIADIVKLPQWIAARNRALVDTDNDLAADYFAIDPKRTQTQKAYVAIQTGCNKFCTYCVVPFSRGFERNRPLRDIFRELHALTDAGCVEITLLGQTVNSYVAPDPDFFSSSNPYKNHFAALLFELNQIEGISRIHFTAPHPLSMNDEIIDAMTLPRHLNYLHLPVQAGDNEVLRRMNRRYTREYYIELVTRIREKIPHIALGTDIIVGFCGETDAQFERTLDLYRICDFDISYNAMYSPRTGTVAHKAWKDDVLRDEKKRRFRIVQEIMVTQTLKKNQLYVNHHVEVLVDSFIAVEGEKGWCEGNSREMKRVRFPGVKEQIGLCVNVQVMKAQEWMLYAR